MNIQLNKEEARAEQEKQQRSGVNHTEFHLQISEVRSNDATHQVDLVLHSCVCTAVPARIS